MRQGYMLSLIVLMAFSLSGCVLGPFTLTVTPENITDAIPNQRCVFLAWANNSDGDNQLLWPVTLTATAVGAEVIIDPPSFLPGEMAEITVIPLPLVGDAKQPEEGRTATVTLRAERGSFVEEKTLSINITSEEEDLVGATAAEVFSEFMPWLAENYPELYIDEHTQWTNTIVTPHILIVTHYLFFAPDWEVHVAWHVMIPPYDWARIELRRRFSETLPSMAFEIPSRSANPIQINPVESSDVLWR